MTAVFGVLRGIGWTLLVAAAFGLATLVICRLRLGWHVHAGASAFERRALWDKDDLYTAEGRRLLAKTAFALELAIASGAAGALLLLLVPVTDSGAAAGALLQ